MSLTPRPHVQLSLAGAVALLVLAGAGCATPYKEPVATQPITAGEGEAVEVDRVIVLFDASRSIHRRWALPDEKAWAESFVQAMPDGSYDAQFVTFGGDTRNGAPLAPFDRDQLAATTSGIESIGGGSPLVELLDATAEELKGTTGNTAIVLMTDGIADRPKMGSPEEPVVFAAEQLAASTEGEVCYHTVLSGDDPVGRERLQKIADVTPCGSFRESSTLASAGEIETFQRDIFLGAAPPPLPAVAAGPVDSDGDGIPDAMDACAGTPAGASADESGCWKPETIRFESDSDQIVGMDRENIDAMAAVLEANPALRLQIAGYTDSTGPAAYNLVLSQRRADRVAQILEEGGIPAERLDVKGYGEADPIGDNATPEGRAENRRIELTVE